MAENEKTQGGTESKEHVSKPPRRSRRWLGWFIGGSLLSFLSVCSALLFVIVIASLSLNVYLAVALSGIEINLVTPAKGSLNGFDWFRPLVSVVPQEVPATAVVQVVTATPVIAEQIELPPAELSPVIIPVSTPAPASDAQPAPPIVQSVPAENSIPNTEISANSQPESPPAQSVSAENPVPDEALASRPVTSDNSYKLLRLSVPGDGRLPEVHGDLNLALRNPQPSTASRSLKDYVGGDDDSANSPKLAAYFDPGKIKSTYTPHGWDWGCAKNPADGCIGPLMTDKDGYIIGIETTIGEPIYIPKPNPRNDIFASPDGTKYYAVVLYASENSLTFVYARDGVLANAYAVHYENFNVDPNLLEAFRQRTADELPGLTIETPVGTAKDELIISMRDKGRFFDARSRRDWW